MWSSAMAVLEDEVANWKADEDCCFEEKDVNEDEEDEKTLVELFVATETFFRCSCEDSQRCSTFC